MQCPSYKNYVCATELRKPSFCVRGVCAPDYKGREVKRERFAMLIVRYNIINGIERFRA